MRRDHLMFAFVCALMFLAPRVPAALVWPDSPGKSSISLLTGGLLLWAVVRPKYLWTVPGTIRRSAYFMVWFALFALSSTFLSFNTPNLIYAVQYALVSFVSAMLLSNYIARATNEGKLNVIVRILVGIGTLFALGGIVSYWTGPIYPQQVLDYGRHWLGVRLSQGVGFSTNPNSAGGFMIFFIAMLIMLYKAGRAKQVVLSGVMMVALFMTISRSAIIGCAIGLGVMLAVLFATRKQPLSMSRDMRHTLSRITIGIVIIAVLLALLGAFYAETRGSLIEGLWFGQESIMAMEQGRISAWENGLSLWADGSPVTMLLGRGFRGSAVQKDLYFATSHNFFIAVLGDFGMLGLLLLVIPLFIVMRNAAFLDYQKSRNGLFALWVLTAFLVINQTDTFLYGIEYLFLTNLVSMMTSVTPRNAKPLRRRHVRWWPVGTDSARRDWVAPEAE